MKNETRIMIFVPTTISIIGKYCGGGCEYRKWSPEANGTWRCDLFGDCRGSLLLNIDSDKNNTPERCQDCLAAEKK